ncbi:MAG: CARDB domain-containing protein [Promethearchaeota archaeon]
MKEKELKKTIFLIFIVTFLFFSSFISNASAINVNYTWNYNTNIQSSSFEIYDKDDENNDKNSMDIHDPRIEWIPIEEFLEPSIFENELNLNPIEGESINYDIKSRIETIVHERNLISDTNIIDGFESPAENRMESVIYPDDRQRITSTTSLPWSSVVKLYMRWGGSYYIGSGAMIDSFHILTAGHCIYQSGLGGWVDEIIAVPAKDVSFEPYGTVKATELRSVTGWTSLESYQHDFGVITLDRTVGYYTGWMGRETASPTDPIYTETLHTAGYPADRNYGESIYYDSDNGNYVDEYNHWYWMDTFGGQSGSAVWREDANSRYILSIHAYGGGGINPNFGTRLNGNKFNLINSWLLTDAVPDLMDRGNSYSGFTPSLVIDGSSSFNVWCDVINAGTIDAGSFTISYYASLDDIISTSDYLLGTDTISFISALDTINSGWSGIFPSGVPDGTYYIGWIIDSDDNIVETDFESNNVGLASGKITVTSVDAPSDPYPADGATGLNLNPILSVYISDTDKDLLDVFFYDASENSLIGVDYEVPNASIASVSWSGLFEGSTYYWYAVANDGMISTVSPTWSFTTNYAPNAPSNPSPSDGAKGVSKNPTLSVYVSDNDGNSMDVSFFNASDNSLIGIDYGVPNASIASVPWSGLSLSSPYYWYAMANDSMISTVSPIWSFTTNYAPNAPSNPSPTDKASGVIDIPTLSVYVSDDDGNSMDVSFYDASNNLLIDTITGVPNGGYAFYSWFGLSEGSTYYWYAVANDGIMSTASPTWSFTTNYAPNAPSNPSPTDKTSGVITSPTLSVYVSDKEGNLMYVNFFDASDNSLIGIDTGVSNGSIASVPWSGLSEGSTYYWYAVASDGIFSHKTSPIWSFTTNYAPNAPSNPSPTDGATGVSTNPTLSLEVSDNDGDLVDVFFYDASDDSLIGIDYEVPNGGIAYMPWQGLSRNSTYYWYAVANDSMLFTKSLTWSFITKKASKDGESGDEDNDDDGGGGIDDGILNFLLSPIGLIIIGGGITSAGVICASVLYFKKKGIKRLKK